MRFSIERDVLLKALQRVTSVVEKRTTIPILANVVLAASEDGLILRATDLDMEISEVVQAEVDEAGSVTLPALTLRDIVGKFTGAATISFAVDLERMSVQVKSGRSRFNLQYLSSEDYPEVGLGRMSHRFKLPLADLLVLLNSTALAMSTDETRYYLNGIFLHSLEVPQGWRLRGVSTDGHRLARMDVVMPEGAEGMPGVILPRKAVRELIKLLQGGKGDVAVEVSAAKMRFILGDVALVTKLIDGTFPDYMRVIPQDEGKPMKANSELLSQAVSRIAIVSDGSKPVKFVIVGGELTISSRGQGSDASETLPVEFDGEFEVGFSARYLAELFAQIGGEFTVFGLTERSAPAIIRDSAEDEALYVLMPMRV